jgi:crotonobetainyl-CoA:carnitine CoA-transferase CaiB-like acyl-CoA transferase
MAGSLDGIRVVELATGVAGPYCGKLLAGLGADVLKVEPTAGDWTRHEGPFPGGTPDHEKSGLFLHLNTRKRGATLAAAVPDPARLDALCAWADVLITSVQPAEASPGGVDLAALRARYPGLVLVNVSPFGLTGPHADWHGGELIAYAASGYMDLTGSAEGVPIKAHGHLISYQAGAHAAMAVLAGLAARDRSGHGTLIDTALSEAGTFLLGGVEQQAFHFGRIAKRNGTRLLGFPPEHSYPSTIRPCADGYVHCHSNNRHLDLLGALMETPRLLDADVLHAMMGHADEIDAIMDAWLAGLTRAEAVERAQAMRLPFTEVFTPREVLTNEHLAARGSFVTIDHPVAGRVRQPGAPFRMGATPWQPGPAPVLGLRLPALPARPALPAQASREGRPLEGIRVLEFTNAVAGPIAGSLLGLLGADVIKVEAPTARPRRAAGTAPLASGAADRPWDRIPLYNCWNHSKEAISLDVATPDGRDLFIRLAQQCDVLLQNFSPRVMPNLGLDYDTLSAARPGLVFVSMPAFGLDGPYRDRGSYGPGVDAMSGLSHLTGYADGPPMKPGNFFCDQQAAVLAAIATLAALRHRDRTREGQHVELAMLDGELQVVGDALLAVEFGLPEPVRSGNDHHQLYPHGVYRCTGSDAWVAIAIEDDTEWPLLAGVIGPADLAADTHFATAPGRRARRHDVDAAITAWTSSRSPETAAALLQNAGVPAAPVSNALGLLSDAHTVARGVFQYSDVPGIGANPFPRPAMLFDGAPLSIERPPAAFAGANLRVLRDLLGLSEHEIASLGARGIITDEPQGAGH